MNPTSTTPWRDTQKILALGLTIAFVAVIFMWMTLPPKGGDAATNILNTLVGALATMETMVVSFYFGSSRGSVTKDSTIAALASPQGYESSTDGTRIQSQQSSATTISPTPTPSG